MSASSRVRMRTIAFPVEHGGWGFLAEPLLLSLLLAPSRAGWLITVGTAAAFLARHPAKMYARNRHRLEVSPRFRMARRFAAAYVALAAAAFGGAAVIAGWRTLTPFLLLSPLLMVYGVYDANNRGRRLLPELAAPMGLAAAAPSIALAGGWEWPAAWALWVILQARALPSILYVRARLRLERGTRIDRRPAIASHVTAVAVGALLWRAGRSPFLAVIALAVLLVRAGRGLAPNRRPARAKQVGFTELGLGLGYVLAIVLGFRLGV